MYNRPFVRQTLLDIPKRRVFVSYHHYKDQKYYDEFSYLSANYNVITDKSLNRNINSANPNYVMRKIREDYITGTSATVVLCGAETSNRKYVDWEIEVTLDKKHALIGVCLPTARKNRNGSIIVPGRFASNYHAGYAIWVAWKELIHSGYALSHYINRAVEHSQKNSYRIDNSRPLMLRNKTRNYSF